MPSDVCIYYPPIGIPPPIAVLHNHAPSTLVLILIYTLYCAAPLPHTPIAVINPQAIMLGQEARQTTSNIGHLNKPSIQALIHGLNRHYYSININYRKNDLDQKMLLNLHKKVWSEGLKVAPFDEHAQDNEETVKDMEKLAESYATLVTDETKMSAEKLLVQNVGKIDAKKRLQANVDRMMASNIAQCLGIMVDAVVF
eukprot:TRINITY_DN2448_c0_g1_i2.p2 TRINITY_DN2448_c0_g1~~TRINITY_DN2448_c0_g1_i2.p2  ORF type:complete len:198 (+),score=45.97 TRINITY_DN2448_c0_g1_i2:751-1344(+)